LIHGVGFGVASAEVDFDAAVHDLRVQFAGGALNWGGGYLQI